MALLDQWAGADKFDVLQTKTNAAISKVNDIKANLEPLTDGQVAVQSGTTDFNFVGKLVPFLKDGELPRTKVRLSIGDWNMDTSGTTNVAHNLNSTQWKTICIVGIIIRNDADNAYYSLANSASDGTSDGGNRAIDSTNIVLGRHTGGFFDDATFNSTSYNRGFVDIEYTP